MGRLLETIEPLLKRDSPVVIHGAIPAGFDETAADLVNFVLAQRAKKVNYFPAFTGQSEIFDVSTASILNGEISEAAFQVLGAKARTVHPTHSWMVTGRSAAIMIPGNIYAMTPSGMGSPVPEITNYSSLEFLIGTDFMQSVVIEAAEENARVPYALNESQVPVKVITAEGKIKEESFKLRSQEPIVRNREKIRELWLKEDALVELDWGCLIQTRVAHDRLVSQLREDPEWLIK
jgi:aminoglycoside N3'-acetyltransferase